MAQDGTTIAMTPQARQSWTARSAAAAQSGLRLLALAKKHPRDAAADPYGDLTLIGLVCLRDPIRADVPKAIAASRAAGVRVVMLTGDHADTAQAIALAAGLGDGALKVIEGSALADLAIDTVSDAQRQEILAADVFARVTPEVKMTLVALYQQAGHVVAMTGDGVNDAPALKKADIGIAMGLRGTEVAKEAAHMILGDDAFSTIILAMRQGRVIFGNIRNFVIYLMSCNVSEVLVVGLAVAGGLPTPLLPLQILYLNLVTDIFPAFALGFGRGDAHVMTRPPRDPGAPIVTARHLLLLAILGGAITVATLGAFGLALFWLAMETQAAITVAFLTLALAQMWNVFNLRNPEAGVLRNDVTANPYVWGAIVLCLLLIAAALWVPLLAEVLRLAWPGLALRRWPALCRWDWGKSGSAGPNGAGNATGLCRDPRDDRFDPRYRKACQILVDLGDDRCGNARIPCRAQQPEHLRRGDHDQLVKALGRRAFAQLLREPHGKRHLGARVPIGLRHRAFPPRRDTIRRGAACIIAPPGTVRCKLTRRRLLACFLRHDLKLQEIRVADIAHGKILRAICDDDPSVVSDLHSKMSCRIAFARERNAPAPIAGKLPWACA